MVLYPNKLPESERVCSGICNLTILYKFLYYPKSFIYCIFKLFSSNGVELFNGLSDYYFFKIYL